jgi:hypothetical protein
MLMAIYEKRFIVWKLVSLAQAHCLDAHDLPGLRPHAQCIVPILRRHTVGCVNDCNSELRHHVAVPALAANRDHHTKVKLAKQ